MTDLRSDLPEPIPAKMLKLPVARGYPVPYFVAWLDGDGKPLPRGQGTPDFRVLFPDVVRDCYFNERCWVCGGFLNSAWQSFVIGPMCSVTRTSAEPGGHYDCACWAAAACPFLARPHARRRDITGPAIVDAPGEMIDRNPGASCVWTSRNAHRFPDGRGGFLFNVGDPSKERPPIWFAQGREATREEVMESINSGLPILDATCDKDPDPVESRQALSQQVAAVTDHLIPA